ncbi:MAG: hypothetical protein GX558_10995, partial [Clostridiales bacterium]|nr:hypothetical protein [Clostridiales bacterium]
MYAMRTDERGLTLAGEGLRVSIGAAGPGRMRIWTTARDAFEEPPRWVLAEDAPTCAPTVVERVGGGYRVTGDGMYAEVVPEPLSIAFFRDGRPLLRTAPGPVFARDGARLTVRFAFPPGEAVYGLGQNTRHALNLRDVERRMWNQYDAGRYSGNAGIPFLLNSSGYGVLLNTSWAARIALGRAEPCEGNERVVKPAAPWPLAEPGPERDPEKWAAIVEGGDLDLFVLSGDDYGAIMRGYYEMTGHPPMPPKWALGLMQCKNRYKNQKQLLEVARGYRRRGLPLDVMIIDWNWFRYFGFFRWLPGDWPDPAGMFRELRSMGIRVLAAVHPYMHEQSPFFESFERAGALIEWSPQGAGYWPPFGIHHAVDFTHPEARRIFWETVKPLVEQGLAGFWTDMGELEVHPEDSTPMYLGTREQAHNLYTSCWTDAIYRGWRGVFDTRCFSLPRTSYAGTQRNGCAMWTGDVDSSFDVLRDQIMIIQQLSVSGQPFTCSDIGGFIAPPYYDPELYTRWYL